MSRIVVDELVTILGTEQSPATRVNVEKFRGQMIVLGNQVADIFGKMWDAGQRVASAFNRAGESALGSQMLSDRIGLTTGRIQELGYAAVATGGSVGALQSDLDKLNMLSGGNLEAMLSRLSGSMKGMTPLQAQYYGRALGLTDDTIKVLRQGTEGIKALAAEGRRMGAVIPDAAIERTAQYQKQLNAIRLSWRQMVDQVFMGVAPSLLKVTEGFRNLIAVHGDEWGKGLATVFAGVSDGALKMLDSVQKAYDWVKEKAGISKLSPGAQAKIVSDTTQFLGVVAGWTALRGAASWLGKGSAWTGAGRMVGGLATGALAWGDWELLKNLWTEWNDPTRRKGIFNPTARKIDALADRPAYRAPTIPFRPGSKDWWWADADAAMPRFNLEAIVAKVARYGMRNEEALAKFVMGVRMPDDYATARVSRTPGIGDVSWLKDFGTPGHTTINVTQYIASTDPQSAGAESASAIHRLYPGNSQGAR